jgi:hypothetical protein
VFDCYCNSGHARFCYRMSLQQIRITYPAVIPVKSVKCLGLLETWYANMVCVHRRQRLAKTMVRDEQQIRRQPSRRQVYFHLFCFRHRIRSARRGADADTLDLLLYRGESCPLPLPALVFCVHRRDEMLGAPLYSVSHIAVRASLARSSTCMRSRHPHRCATARLLCTFALDVLTRRRLRVFRISANVGLFF